MASVSKAHSTQLALTLLTDKITQALNNGESCIGMFLDFSKAFNTINHQILTRKLHHYGIRGTPLKWFASYLTDRSQYVQYNKQTSSRKTFHVVYHRGLFLDPCCFSFILMTYHKYLINIFFALLFADDSNMFITCKKLIEMAKSMNEELQNISQWLKTNKLSFNILKNPPF